MMAVDGIDIARVDTGMYYIQQSFVLCRVVVGFYPSVGVLPSMYPSVDSEGRLRQ